MSSATGKMKLQDEMIIKIMKGGRFMKRFKVEEYAVFEKGRKYSVLVFPQVKHMWAYDDYPEENRYMIDGPVQAFSLLKYATAILLEASDKIIYFPCRQDGIGCYYNENYDLVLCSPKVQLRRSSWIDIRRKLSDKTKVGKYTLQYDRKKIDDYCEKKLLDMKQPYGRRDFSLKPEYSKRIQREHLEEVCGNTLFRVLGNTECYYAHYLTAKDLDTADESDRTSTWSWFGWFLPQYVIRVMYKKEAMV